MTQRQIACIRLAIVCTVASFAAGPLAAQQLTNPGGQTAVIQNDGNLHAAEFNYSLGYNIAIGPVVSYTDGSDTWFGGVQATYLVKRFIGDFSQFNIVTSAGIGIEGGGSQGGAERSRVAAFTQLSAAYTSRRRFASYAIRASKGDGQETELRQTARAGIVPYVARPGHVQPFLALQIDRFDGPRQEWRATPFVQLIRGAGVIEVGVNTNGGVLANFVYLF